MSNVLPIKPSFTLSYWKPWREDSNMFDSWTTYVKDLSLAEYTADTIGRYIQEASAEQVNQLNAVRNQLSYVNTGLNDLNDNIELVNRNIELQIEQQRIANLLLQDIVELLKVPDSEKERQYSIELGLKFFSKAEKDLDLYEDALESLQKAEKLLKQDYFVLYRIGLIYLHAPQLINVPLALDYFLRSAKYASVETNTNEELEAYLFNYNFPEVKQTTSSVEVDESNPFAAQAFEKAAFCYYLEGDFEKAIQYQEKAIHFFNSEKNLFLLSKYQSRLNLNDKAKNNLIHSIQLNPKMYDLAFADLDLLSNKDVVKCLDNLNDELNVLIKEFDFEDIPSAHTNSLRNELDNLITIVDYSAKVKKFQDVKDRLNIIRNKLLKIEEIQSTNKGIELQIVELIKNNASDEKIINELFLKKLSIKNKHDFVTVPVLFLLPFVLTFVLYVITATISQDNSTRWGFSIAMLIFFFMFLGFILEFIKDDVVSQIEKIEVKIQKIKGIIDSRNSSIKSKKLKISENNREIMKIQNSMNDD
jgi:tetratricopeptide (TPR) repeat protein